MSAKLIPQVAIDTLVRFVSNKDDLTNDEYNDALVELECKMIDITTASNIACLREQTQYSLVLFIEKPEFVTILSNFIGQDYLFKEDKYLIRFGLDTSLFVDKSGEPLTVIVVDVFDYQW